uniref:Protein kinase domain-containing protein n=1 Tax=Rhodosorus marinus TaxID=101924 RepID=A0A7S3A896_9RHOD|mmetsp:Transcript_5324/g.22577  ORF Transcript_5324/g.22577 Transcript_5324/m.22577 type:complete len:800 (+) Transcript_5324:457-2856(+)|eukprot:CAMPEP_0113955220 /NCGR_PEP_ID=MMETSP0011_2-20120614/1156_1 /TAXON_ID=101924 /ORGANISM="Rhodosorus marinus" /LENGTH=799 /DNA_ID=CAMNT_0000964773 /DNA_START=204 /DNA_END=2606 /DNA_ORIENTATION=- /assembly_acc=CAM_ASM_000156
MSAAEAAEPGPSEMAAQSEEDRRSTASTVGQFDDQSVRESTTGRPSIDSRASGRSSKSKGSIRFSDAVSFPSRTDSNVTGTQSEFSQGDDVRSFGAQSSRFSGQSETSSRNSIRSAAQFTNAEGVSVDLAGRGLAGMSVGGTEVVNVPSSALKPERPSGLLSVHSSRYEAMRGREPAPRKDPLTAKPQTAPGPKKGGSRSYSGPPGRMSRHSTRDTMTTSRASGTGANARRSSRRGMDDDESFRDSFGSSRNSEARTSSRTSRMSFTKRASSLWKSQDSFKEGKEIGESSVFGDNATLHTLGKKTVLEELDPEDIQLDLYINDLEFTNGNLAVDEETINSDLFYKYQLVSEHQRLLLVKWLVATHDDEELRALSTELGGLLNAAPKTEKVMGTIDEEQTKDVPSYIEETDKMLRGEKHKELRAVYEQRLNSVVEAIVMKAHISAEQDFLDTQLKDDKGKNLLDVNLENMHFRFYDTYETTIEIGEGHLSKIYLCNVKNKPEDLFAVKVVSKKGLSKSRLKYLKNECNLSQRLLHPCLVKTYDVYDHWDYSWIVMEYVSGGSLLDVLRRVKYLDEEDAKKVMFEILRAVAFLHEEKIVHRDLKFDNILCTQSEFPFSIKVADFGLAQVVQQKTIANTRVPRTDDKEAYQVVKENEDKEKGVVGEAPKEAQGTDAEENEADVRDSVEEREALSSAVGTPSYAAPELLRGNNYSFPVDVWSCGVMLYGILSGSRPFSGNDADQVLASIQRTGLQFPKTEWGFISDQARSLCRAMLEVNPQYRVSAEEAMRHTWFTSMSSSQG